MLRVEWRKIMKKYIVNLVHYHIIIINITMIMMMIIMNTHNLILIHNTYIWRVNLFNLRVDETSQTYKSQHLFPVWCITAMLLSSFFPCPHWPTFHEGSSGQVSLPQRHKTTGKPQIENPNIHSLVVEPTPPSKNISQSKRVSSSSNKSGWKGKHICSRHPVQDDYPETNSKSTWK